MLIITGCPPQHGTLQSMAETIRKRRGPSFVNSVDNTPLGEEWTRALSLRHSVLPTTVVHAIDANRVKYVSLLEILKVVWGISANNWKLPNYKRKHVCTPSMKVGFQSDKLRLVVSLSTLAFDKSFKLSQDDKSGFQHWNVSDAILISPLIIFKGEGLTQQWIPGNTPEDWKFSYTYKVSVDFNLPTAESNESIW